MKCIKSLDVCVGSALLFFYCSQFFISAQNQFCFSVFQIKFFFFVGENNKNNNKVKLIILTAESRAGGLRQKYNNEK